MRDVGVVMYYHSVCSVLEIVRVTIGDDVIGYLQFDIRNGLRLRQSTFRSSIEFHTIYT